MWVRTGTKSGRGFQKQFRLGVWTTKSVIPLEYQVILINCMCADMEQKHESTMTVRYKWGEIRSSEWPNDPTGKEVAVISIQVDWCLKAEIWIYGADTCARIGLRALRKCIWEERPVGRTLLWDISKRLFAPKRSGLTVQMTMIPEKEFKANLLQNIRTYRKLLLQCKEMYFHENVQSCDSTLGWHCSSSFIIMQGRISLICDGWGWWYGRTLCCMTGLCLWIDTRVEANIRRILMIISTPPSSPSLALVRKRNNEDKCMFAQYNPDFCRDMRHLGDKSRQKWYGPSGCLPYVHYSGYQNTAGYNIYAVINYMACKPVIRMAVPLIDSRTVEWYGDL